MKYLLLILICLTACTKEPAEQSYTCFTGQNDFTPTRPKHAYLHDAISYDFKLSGRWDTELTNSLAHGCKLPAIGAWDYHNGGANIGIMAGPTLHGRYYVDQVLYVFDEIPIQVDRWYTVRIELRPVRIYLDGELIGSADVYLRSTFWTASYVGKKDVYTASNDLTITFR